MAAPSLRTAFFILLFYSCLITLWKATPPHCPDSSIASGSSASYSLGLPYGHWVDTWAAAPQAVGWNDRAPPAMKAIAVPFNNVTIRQTIHLTLGAEHFRLRLSNEYGSTELRITNVTVAIPTPGDGGLFLGSNSVAPWSLRTVTFSESEWVTVPQRAIAVSDPISFGYAMNASYVITVSMYLRDGHDGDVFTGHLASMTRAWMDFGDHTRSASMAGASAVLSQYFISAVETWQEPDCNAFAIIGDSISDSIDTRVDVDGKWPSLLFTRMREEPDTSRISVVNQAIGGNRLLQDSKSPNALSLIDRDVVAHSGIRYVLVWEGINDIGRGDPTEDAQRRIEAHLIQFYKQIITRLHTFNIVVFGSTMTPFLCDPDIPDGIVYSKTLLEELKVREQTRLRVNAWIRTSAWFDAVIDFDKVFRDPLNHSHVTAGIHKGDCVHPSNLGRRALAEHFPLELFKKFKYDIDTFK